jgi:hypothetical protein
MFTRYIILGSLLFSHIEPWSFEQAGQFAIMTLLTIGYGDIVPLSFWGRLVTILYTIVGLTLAGFYILSFQDIVIANQGNCNIF